MDAASIEEINKVRLAMGMKPLPVPGAAPPPTEATTEIEIGDDGKAVSTLDSREAASYDNYRKALDAEDAKKKREAKAAAIKKARELAQRSAVVAGKGLADDDDEVDVKSWLKNQKKRQKKIETTRKTEEEKAAAEAQAAEHTAADLAGVKVAHDMSTFLDGDDQILTLKDTGVLENEEEGDELENLALREQESLQERLDLKKKKPAYDPNDVDETGEIGLLSKYDEEIFGKKKKAFALDALAASTDLADILEAPVQRRKHQVDMDMLGGYSHDTQTATTGLMLTEAGTEDAPAPTSDYLDASEIKVKKPKKKKSKSTRRRRDDDEDALFPGDAAGDEPVQDMDIDAGAAIFTKKRKVVDDSFVDDEDLQSSLALQRREALKKRKKMRPEDIARQLREEAQNGEGEAEEEEKGIVMDETSRFVDGLRAESEEDHKPRRPKPEEATTTTAMAQDGSASEDEEMHDADQPPAPRSPSPSGDVPTTGVEEEKTVGQGMGATLALLRDRHLIEEGKGAEVNAKFRQRQRFLNELQRRREDFDQDTRAQRERDRASGRLDRMSAREREDWQRQQNTMREQHQARVMDQLFREGYRPDVELKYVDGEGRSLDAKEAFKELSHQFHGKGSGKGKTDKKLKKLAEEKRRMAQSMLDASQNVGMSSAASHQTKKRREAGVRLA
jgi:U4/U6.U5 tri-snRNP-associated protein 1